MPSDLTKHVWLPYTQMKSATEPLCAVATKGSRIKLKDGRELIDGLASWWTSCHGYNHAHITEELKKQLDQMPHIMFGGIVHEPAVKLAQRLSALMPSDLDHVFFVDSGSVAVEVALKIAVQYWLNKGEKSRTKFVSFRHAYHGDTRACMALCDPDEGMHAQFRDWLPKEFIAHLPDSDEHMLEFDRLMLRENKKIAAVIIEPLVQAGGGMKFHEPRTLKRVSELCQKHNILLIADEIFTGFGRTGTMFACERASIVPDILCLGKALTGGAITLAAAVARRHVFDAFLSDQPGKALMHGPTYMANPLACTAANASLDLFETEPRLEQVKTIEKLLTDGLAACRGKKGVEDVRVLGAIGVVELQPPIDHVWFRNEFIKRGVWIRPLETILYLAPAFTISREELNQLITALNDVLSVWAKNRD